MDCDFWEKYLTLKSDVEDCHNLLASYTFHTFSTLLQLSPFKTWGLWSQRHPSLHPAIHGCPAPIGRGALHQRDKLWQSSLRSRPLQSNAAPSGALSCRPHGDGGGGYGSFKFRVRKIVRIGQQAVARRTPLMWQVLCITEALIKLQPNGKTTGNTESSHVLSPWPLVCSDLECRGGRQVTSCWCSAPRPTTAKRPRTTGLKPWYLYDQNRSSVSFSIHLLRNTTVPVHVVARTYATSQSMLQKVRIPKAISSNNPSTIFLIFHARKEQFATCHLRQEQLSIFVWL